MMTPSPTFRHQRILKNLQFVVEGHIRSRDLGTLLPAPMDVLFAPTSVVQPDLLFIKQERLHIVTETNIQGAPDLVVEVLSSSSAAIDRGGKMLLYAKYGVPHYWIADSDRLTLEMYELEGEKYRLAAQFGKDDRAQSPLFPGLVIPVAELER